MRKHNADAGRTDRTWLLLRASDGESTARDARVADVAERVGWDSRATRQALQNAPVRRTSDKTG